MKEGGQILSSTGDLGLSRRSHNRLYINGTEYVERPDVFQSGALKVAETVSRGRFPRAVFRGIVSEDVMGHINGTKKWADHLEVALPLKEFTGDNSWFVSLAHNAQGRDPIVDKLTMIQETSVQNKEITPPLVRVKDLVDQDFSFSGSIEDGDIEQIYLLWGPTFGWDQEKGEVEALQRRLAAGRLINPSQKNVWQSTVKDEEGNIAGLATAELLSRPGKKGHIDIVESTEWRIHPRFKGKGVMQAAIAMLNAQILSDLQGSSNSGPLVYAECNYASRADRVGNSALLSIPDRRFASQILAQNVAVGDGLELGTPLRDFTFMYLTQKMIDEYYSSADRTAMLKCLSR